MAQTMPDASFASGKCKITFLHFSSFFYLFTAYVYFIFEFSFWSWDKARKSKKAKKRSVNMHCTFWRGIPSNRIAKKKWK